MVRVPPIGRRFREAADDAFGEVLGWTEPETHKEVLYTAEARASWLGNVDLIKEGAELLREQCA